MKLSHQIRPSRKVLVARALLLLFSAGAASTVLAGELTIEISGVTPDRGKVYVAVYDRPETFPIPGKQLVGRVMAAGDRHLTAHFADLPPGQYAVVAFQDFNDNGQLDKNFLGIPKEPYGFSNGARGSAGPPKFAAAAVTLGPDGTTKVELK
jgi:uncharacterized protein (DUF2141 family)